MFVKTVVSGPWIVNVKKENNMDVSYLLQCDDCKKTLSAFVKAYPETISNVELELLTNFSLFIEMKRLKDNQVVPTLGTPMISNPFFDKMVDFNPNKLQITC